MAWNWPAFIFTFASIQKPYRRIEILYGYHTLDQETSGSPIESGSLNGMFAVETTRQIWFILKSKRNSFIIISFSIIISSLLVKITFFIFAFVRYSPLHLRIYLFGYILYMIDTVLLVSARINALFLWLLDEM